MNHMRLLICRDYSARSRRRSRHLPEAPDDPPLSDRHATAPGIVTLSSWRKAAFTAGGCRRAPVR